MFLLVFVWCIVVYVGASVCGMYAFTCMRCAQVHLYGLQKGHACIYVCTCVPMLWMHMCVLQGGLDV